MSNKEEDYVYVEKKRVKSKRKEKKRWCEMKRKTNVFFRAEDGKGRVVDVHLSIHNNIVDYAHVNCSCKSAIQEEEAKQDP